MFIPIPSVKIDASFFAGAGASAVVCAFIPSILRKLKSGISKLAGKIVAAGEAEAKKVEAGVEKKL